MSEDRATVCASACREVDGVATPEVWQNLNSQGVCRFVGFLTVMENLGKLWLKMDDTVILVNLRHFLFFELVSSQF